MGVVHIVGNDAGAAAPAAVEVGVQGHILAVDLQQEFVAEIGLFQLGGHAVGAAGAGAGQLGPDHIHHTAPGLDELVQGIAAAGLAVGIAVGIVHQQPLPALGVQFQTAGGE